MSALEQSGPLPQTTVLFNAACSKCRTTQGILADHGVDATYVDYLHDPPTVAELEQLLGMLGATDARELVRTEEPIWGELGLFNAGGDEILEALSEHPILIQRPIVIVGDRAVIARPPRRVLEILS